MTSNSDWYNISLVYLRKLGKYRYLACPFPGHPEMFKETQTCVFTFGVLKKKRKQIKYYHTNTLRLNTLFGGFRYVNHQCAMLIFSNIEDYSALFNTKKQSFKLQHCPDVEKTKSLLFSSCDSPCVLLASRYDSFSLWN